MDSQWLLALIVKEQHEDDTFAVIPNLYMKVREQLLICRAGVGSGDLVSGDTSKFMPQLPLLKEKKVDFLTYPWWL